MSAQRFRAWKIDRDAAGTQSAAIAEMSAADLMAGDVLVRVAWSTLNYKDALALTGTLPVVRRFPMIPGVDFVGQVVESESAAFRPGDRVMLNGFGVGETHLGGYAGLARLPGDWLIPLPDGLSGREAMAIGTAGYAAMLSLMALERHGLTPAAGPAVVTGAAGGVGSLAVALLAGQGFAVSAVTGRADEAAYLKGLGAVEIIPRADLSAPARPLARERWAAGIDAVGGAVLANVLAMTRRNGAVAACGNAGGMDLPTSVAPFILRGVALLGVDTVFAARALRVEAWRRLAAEIDRARLAAMTTEIAFDDLAGAARELIAGRVRGRTVVRIPEPAA